MKTTIFSIIRARQLLWVSLWIGLGAWPGQATPTQYLQITINSNRDEIRTDDVVTLREAIAIVNGQISLDHLSPAEQQQVKATTQENRLQFQLPVGQTQILLQSELPALTTTGVVVDGRSSSYPNKVSIQDLTFETPTIEITPAPGKQVHRGLTVLADSVTIAGLSIYGFQVGDSVETQNLPAADIMVGDPGFVVGQGKAAPQNILIENNFLGVQPQRLMPTQTSDFGVYVFNSQGTTIRHNAIGYHSASAIISQVNASNLLVDNNAIFGNGTQGIPDAIRLEGILTNNQIHNNLICGNDGSGIYIFKPQRGAVQITDNRLQSNGRRLRRAAIHLMGNDHQVRHNAIEFQGGAGVAVTAFAPSAPGDLPGLRNQVVNNRFQQLEGLSIDLLTYRNDAVEDFQDGDGLNPPRNSENRRLDTGNGAINAPHFWSQEFYLVNNRVNLDGTADPGSQVEIYRVNVDRSTHGPLSQSLTTVTADAQGHFQATLSNISSGTTLSAIATDPRYGSSEPASNVLVVIPGQTQIAEQPQVIPPDCLLANLPSADVPTVAENPPVPTVTKPPVVNNPPAPLQVEIARNIHFALDKATISPTSAQVLQRVAQVLKANPYIQVDLAGHTDPRAPQAYNQALGMRRALAVRNYLLQQGVAPQRMTIRSFGFSKRRSQERGAYPYALDRRVEMEYRDLRGIELQIIDRLDDLQLEK